MAAVRRRGRRLFGGSLLPPPPEGEFTVTIGNDGFGYGYDAGEYGSIAPDPPMLDGYKLERATNTIITDSCFIYFLDPDQELTKSFFTSVTFEGTGGPTTLMSDDASFTASGGGATGTAQWSWSDDDGLDWQSDDGLERVVTVTK